VVERPRTGETVGNESSDTPALAGVASRPTAQSADAAATSDGLDAATAATDRRTRQTLARAGPCDALRPVGDDPAAGEAAG
jgi:hypothetical protein